MKIKEKRLIVLMALLVMVLSSCRKYEIEEKKISENINEEVNVFDQEAAQFPHGYSRMAVSEKGYYYIINDILYFYNIDSDVNMPLCSKGNCLHKGNGCDAYVKGTDTFNGQGFGGNCEGNRVWFYNNHLYCIEQTKDRDYYLVEYDEAFGNRKKIARLASVKDEQLSVSSGQACIISDGYFYFFTTRHDKRYAENGYIARFGCCRIKLEDGSERETLGEFDFPGDYALAAGESQGLSIYLSDNNIYFYAGGTARWCADYDRVQYMVAKYSPAAGAYDTLWSYRGYEDKELLGENTGYVNSCSSGEFVKMDSKGNFYILTSADKEDIIFNKMLVKINFEEGTGKVIYTTKMQNMYSLCSDGRMLYFLESSQGRETESYLVAVDENGNEIARHKFEYEEEFLDYIEAFYTNFPDSEAAMPDARDMVIYGIEPRYILVGNSSDCFKNLASTDMFKASHDQLIHNKVVGVGVIDMENFLSGGKVDIKQIYQYVK